MRVVPPPARRRSPEHVSDQVNTVDQPLSWDHFSVEVTDTGHPAVVRLRGGLDFAYTDHLREVFAGITDRDVICDLRRLTFVDSTGLSVLLAARRTLRDVGGAMSMHGASGLVRRVFEAAELADVLDD